MLCPHQDHWGPQEVVLGHPGPSQPLVATWELALPSLPPHTPSQCEEG